MPLLTGRPAVGTIAAMGHYDRLTSLDVSFLHLEKIETPLHVGAVSVFDGEPFRDEDGRFRLAQVRELVASRLHLIPRFRKRVMNVPFDLGRPIWVDDERFDIAYHVRLTALPHPGSWQQLMTLAERVQEQMLDRARPLWELWFVEGLEGGHVALIQKTHHALVDGVSGVDVATVLLDFEPEPERVEAPAWTPEPAPSAQQLLVDTLIQNVAEPVELAWGWRRAFAGPRRMLDEMWELGRSLLSWVEDEPVAVRSSLNGPVGRHRRLEVVRVPFDDVKHVREVLGGTINDVILAAVAGGLGRLLEARGEYRTGMRVKAFCPVSVRDESDRGSLGNKVAGMFVWLPVGEHDPATRLREVQAATRDLKTKHQALGVDFILGLTHYAAPTLMTLAARVAHRQRLLNLVVTNVPGPQVPLYYMGARMIEAFPIVPLGVNLTLGVAILSYCGKLHLGLNADRDAVPDLGVLVAGIDDAFAELSKAADEVISTRDGPVLIKGARS